LSKATSHCCCCCCYCCCYWFSDGWSFGSVGQSVSLSTK